MKKDVTRYRRLEEDIGLHPRHRRLIRGANRLLENMRSVVVGPPLERTALAMVIGLFARGDSGPGFIMKTRRQKEGQIVSEDTTRPPSSVCAHLILESPPGGGKTLLGKTMASTSGLTFGRIQFTADLTPRDVKAKRVLEGNEAFTYFSAVMLNNIILADEINRATPKTQGALLEAMSEGQVTYEERGNTITYALNEPFLVIATENPIEDGEGTHKLPAAQLDRFTMRERLALPDEETIDAVLNLDHSGMTVVPIITEEDIMDARDFVAREIEVSPKIKRYIKRLIFACYDPLQYKEIFPDLHLVVDLQGAKLVVLPPNTRAALHLRNISQAIAAIDGAREVDPYHVKKRFYEVVNHRFIMNPNLRQHYNRFGGVEEFVQILIKGDKRTGRKGILDVVPFD